MAGCQTELDKAASRQTPRLAESVRAQPWQACERSRLNRMVSGWIIIVVCPPGRIWRKRLSLSGGYLPEYSHFATAARELVYSARSCRVVAIRMTIPSRFTSEYPSFR